MPPCEITWGLFFYNFCMIEHAKNGIIDWDLVTQNIKNHTPEYTSKTVLDTVPVTLAGVTYIENGKLLNTVKKNLKKSN